MVELSDADAVLFISRRKLAEVPAPQPQVAVLRDRAVLVAAAANDEELIHGGAHGDDRERSRRP
ncbi:hypothetical protein [Nonomuraea dietziae]|uniref:hypothetical protein n=1 Tax=Nonomuraea dietziae TaxID=65515 RepID=UPI0031DF6E6E